MKHFAAIALLFALVEPASAEFCDKVRPAWNPDDGSVGQFSDLYLFLVEPLGIFVLSIVMISFLFRNRWIGLVSILGLLLILALVISNWFWLGGEVREYACAEGCVVPPLLQSGLILIAIVFVFVVARLKELISGLWCKAPGF